MVDGPMAPAVILAALIEARRGTHAVHEPRSAGVLRIRPAPHHAVCCDNFVWSTAMKSKRDPHVPGGDRFVAPDKTPAPTPRARRRRPEPLVITISTVAFSIVVLVFAVLILRVLWTAMVEGERPRVEICDSIKDVTARAACFERRSQPPSKGARAPLGAPAPDGAAR
jgi:hypothetical protein